MRRRVAVLAAVFVILTGFGAVHLPSGTAASHSAAKTCSTSYVLAHLSWRDKCLRAGEFCKIGNRVYLRYGFYCPSTGHLRRR
jgi:hypothetical protein